MKQHSVNWTGLLVTFVTMIPEFCHDSWVPCLQKCVYRVKNLAFPLPLTVAFLPSQLKAMTTVTAIPSFFFYRIILVFFQILCAADFCSILCKTVIKVGEKVFCDAFSFFVFILIFIVCLVQFVVFIEHKKLI